MASPKLNADGRRFVIERIIAGDTNNEIRHSLKDAGHPFDLIDQAFSHYRRDKSVQEAIERKDSEAIQSGYAQRSERILKLALSAKRFEKRLALSPQDSQFATSKPFDLVAVHKEYRETIKDITDLVDPVKSQRVELTGKEGAPLVISYVNDWRSAGAVTENDTASVPAPWTGGGPAAS